jgi:hypothetical protein
MYSAYVLEIGADNYRLLITATDRERLSSAVDAEDLRVFIGRGLEREFHLRDVGDEGDTTEPVRFRVWVAQAGILAECRDLRHVVRLIDGDAAVPLTEAAEDRDIVDRFAEVEVAWAALSDLPPLVDPLLDEDAELFVDPGDLDVILPPLRLGRQEEVED